MPQNVFGEDRERTLNIAASECIVAACNQCGIGLGHCCFCHLETYAGLFRQNTDMLVKFQENSERKVARVTKLIGTMTAAKRQPASSKPSFLTLGRNVLDNRTLKGFEKRG